MFGYYFQLAVRSFKRNRALTALMVLAIALGIGASMTQTPVANVIQTSIGVGTVPACPDYSGCGSDGNGDTGFFGGSGTKSNAGCGIRLDGASSPEALGGLGVLMALAMVRRRKQRRASNRSSTSS